jgi:hypothetical protein
VEDAAAVVGERPERAALAQQQAHRRRMALGTTERERRAKRVRGALE